jgi:hypothetical protein
MPRAARDQPQADKKAFLRSSLSAGSKSVLSSSNNPSNVFMRTWEVYRKVAAMRRNRGWPWHLNRRTFEPLENNAIASTLLSDLWRRQPARNSGIPARLGLVLF